MKVLDVILAIGVTGFWLLPVRRPQVASGKRLGTGDPTVPTLFKRDVQGVSQDKLICGHSEHRVLQEWYKQG